MLFRIATLLLAYVSMVGCATDHRKDIAFQTLFSKEGRPEVEAFNAALSARFPSGSSLPAFRTYVQNIGGSCRERESGHLWCEIATSAQFCAASMLGIDVMLRSGAVGTIKVSAGGLGC
jgi:hypothetical protein